MQLFVGRLPKGLNSSELKDVFSEYGHLVRCDVKHGLNHCYGFVEFDNDNDAETAIRATDGMRLHGSRIAVEKSHGRARERDDNTCFRCGGEGHWARDCTQSGGGSRRGGDRGGDRGGHRRGRSRSRSRSLSRSRSRSRSRSPRRSYRDDRRSDRHYDRYSDRRGDRRDSRRDDRRDDRYSDSRRDDRHSSRRDDRRSPSPAGRRQRRSPTPDQSRRSPSPANSRHSPTPNGDAAPRRSASPVSNHASPK